jgi:hypothetical protein
MKDDSIHHSSSDQNPEQEVWLSREEALRLFQIPDRTLKYWRDEKKIIYKKIRNRIYYLESSIRSKSEKYERPKKFLGMRYSKKRELQSIDPVLGLDIISLLVWLVFSPLPSKWGHIPSTLDIIIITILFFSAIYWIVKLIRRIRTKLKSKNNPE